MCPTCGTEVAGYDHAEPRVWQHLNTCQLHTYVHARVPRVKCPTDGVVQARVPWAEPRSRFTLQFERFAIDVLKACSLTAAGRLLTLSRDEAWGILTRAVARGQARKEATPLRYVGVDEKAIAKGHRYHTLVADLETGTVERDRKQDSLERCWQTLTPEQKAGIQGVDMNHVGAVRGGDAQGPPDWDLELPGAPDRDGGAGRDQQQDPVGEEVGVRLPQRRALPHGHLLPLRRP
ncbi:MAG: transposase family protein, partial [bacterium]